MEWESEQGLLYPNSLIPLRTPIQSCQLSAKHGAKSNPTSQSRPDLEPPDQPQGGCVGTHSCCICSPATLSEWMSALDREMEARLQVPKGFYPWIPLMPKGWDLPGVGASCRNHTTSIIPEKSFTLGTWDVLSFHIYICFHIQGHGFNPSTYQRNLPIAFFTFYYQKVTIKTTVKFDCMLP